jgi:hypothetical protein
VQVPSMKASRIEWDIEHLAIFMMLATLCKCF